MNTGVTIKFNYEETKELCKKEGETAKANASCGCSGSPECGSIVTNCLNTAYNEGYSSCCTRLTGSATCDAKEICQKEGEKAKANASCGCSGSPNCGSIVTNCLNTAYNEGYSSCCTELTGSTTCG